MGECGESFTDDFLSPPGKRCEMLCRNGSVGRANGRHLQIPSSLKHMSWRSMSEKNWGLWATAERFWFTMATGNAHKVLHYIDDTVQNIEEELQARPPGKPSITLNRVTGLKPHNQSENGSTEWLPQDHEVTYTFPGRTREEAWRFGMSQSVQKDVLTS